MRSLKPEKDTGPRRRVFINNRHQAGSLKRLLPVLPGVLLMVMTPLLLSGCDNSQFYLELLRIVEEYEAGQAEQQRDYENTGTAVWARTQINSGNLNRTFFNGVETGPDGSVYAAGLTQNTGVFDFGNGVTAQGTGGSNVLLVKYSSSGSAQWARTLEGGTDSAGFEEVSVASDGSVYCAGYALYNTTYDFGNGVTVAGGFATQANILIVKYSSSGTALWAKSTVTADARSTFESVAASPDGSVYAVGSGEVGSYDFGNGVSWTVSGNTSGILIRYASDGTTLWVRSVSNPPGFFSFYDVAAGPDGSVYAAGSINGTGVFDFGNGVNVSGAHSSGNMVIVKYSSSGAVQWARSTVSAGSSSSLRGIAVDPEGWVYVGGELIGNTVVDFGNGVTVQNGTGSGFGSLMIKYSSSGTAQWARSTVSGAGTTNFYDITVDSNGSPFGAGQITSDSLYDFGNGVTVQGPPQMNNVLLIKYLDDGTPQWARTLVSASSFTHFDDAAVSGDNMVYAVGVIGDGSYDFGGTSSPVSGINDTYNVVLVKYE